MSQGLTRRQFSRQIKIEAVQLSERQDMTIAQAAAGLFPATASCDRPMRNWPGCGARTPD